MKQTETMQAMDDLVEIKTTGDLRRLVSNSLLALARKQISATDVTAMAKGLDAISASIDVEIKAAKLDLELKAAGGEIPKKAEMGRMLIN